MKKGLIVPQEWKEIELEDYLELNIVNNKKVKCSGAYFVNIDEKRFMVVFYNYQTRSVNFINYLDEQLEKNEVVNQNGNDNLSYNNHNETKIIKNLFHGYINKDRGVFYLNINKLLLDSKVSYVFQMFTQGKNGIYSVLTNLYELDEEHIETTIDDIPLVKNAIIALIKFAND